MGTIRGQGLRLVYRYWPNYNVCGLSGASDIKWVWNFRVYEVALVKDKKEVRIVQWM